MLERLNVFLIIINIIIIINPIDLGHPLMNFRSLRVVCIKKTQALYICTFDVIYAIIYIYTSRLCCRFLNLYSYTVLLTRLINITYLLRPSKSYLTPPKRLGLGNGLTQVSHHIHTRLRKLAENVKLAKFCQVGIWVCCGLHEVIMGKMWKTAIAEKHLKKEVCIWCYYLQVQKTFIGHLPLMLIIKD